MGSSTVDISTRLDRRFCVNESANRTKIGTDPILD